MNDQDMDDLFRVVVSDFNVYRHLPRGIYDGGRAPNAAKLPLDTLDAAFRVQAKCTKGFLATKSISLISRSQRSFGRHTLDIAWWVGVIGIKEC